MSNSGIIVEIITEGPQGPTGPGGVASATAPLAYNESTRTISISPATTSAAGSLSAADKAKLDGVAAGATANASDAQLRDRSTHTGTQAAGTITGLANVATSGAYSDLSGRPTLGTAAATDASAYATAVQGAKADSAVQYSALLTELAGKADLVGGLVPSVQLPSYVDDVLEYANLAAFPASGEAGKIYVAVATGLIYRWSGSTYVEITPSPGSTDAVPEGSSNLYHTTGRAAAAAPVQSVAGRTGAVTLGVADVSGAAANGAVGSSGLTMTTARLLGRTTASTGAVEEIAVSGGTLSGGTLTITSGTTNASDLSSGTLNDARLSAKVMAAVNVHLWSNFR